MACRPRRTAHPPPPPPLCASIKSHPRPPPPPRPPSHHRSPFSPDSPLRARTRRASSSYRTFSLATPSPPQLIKVSPLVRDALDHPIHRHRVVALESTIITHGLPYPLNLETARACEENVRRNGAVPATVALLHGHAHVGLDDAQLQLLARGSSSGDDGVPAPIKASRRDVAHVLASPKRVGGTTVSATMLLAHLVGIRLFATGGIGGVHRQGHVSLDVSADLVELGRTPVAVFCSGAKSILDIPRTLEYLETMGVHVSSFDARGEFPAFYTARSGCFVGALGGNGGRPASSSSSDGEVRDDAIDEAAAIVDRSHRLGIASGQVFGVPIPSRFEAQGEAIQRAVVRAVEESERLGVGLRGKEVTPWLLRRVGELAPEAGQSNRGLVVNNAGVAARVGVRLAEWAEERVGGGGGDADAGGKARRLNGGATLSGPGA